MTDLKNTGSSSVHNESGNVSPAAGETSMEAEEKQHSALMKVVYVGLFAALSYVVFTFLQVKIPLPGGDATSIHLGNAVVVVAALLLGGVEGGLAGAIGMTVGDLLDPIYVVYAPKTFLCKFLIGVISGFLAHRIFRINQEKDSRKMTKHVLIAAAAGLGFNVIADPLLGYLYKLTILGKPAADITLAINFGSSGVNAVISVIASVIIYKALRKPLKRSGMIGRD